MAKLKEVVKMKGGMRNTGRRFCLMLKRYGLTKHKMLRNIEEMDNLCRKYNIIPTFFTPAYDVWFVYDQDLTKYKMAVHGWRHICYTSLPAKEQEVHLQSIKKVKEMINGFRAPYLDMNTEFLKLLAKYKFKFDSSTTRHFDVVDKTNKAYDAILELYQPADFNLPYIHHGIVEIPVSLPDDEMLIDRLGLNEEQIFDIWTRMLVQSIDEHGMFILALHPERFQLCKQALEKLLKLVKTEGIWTPNMEELADWWKNKPADIIWPNGYTSVFIVSGDIDRLSLL